MDDRHLNRHRDALQSDCDPLNGWLHAWRWAASQVNLYYVSTYAPKIQLRQTTYVLTRAKSTDVSLPVVAFMVAFVAGAVVAIRNYLF